MQAEAQNETTNERIPLAFRMTNPCTGEKVAVKGTVHYVVHFTQDAAGGYQFVDHTTFQGRGVGTSGAKYVGKQVSNSHGTYRQNHTFKFMAYTKFSRQGADPRKDDFQARLVFHFTRNADGEITVEFERSETECK